MASSLNPGAETYIPNRLSYFPPCSSAFTNPNPNFSDYNFFHPFYVEYFHALYQANMVYSYWLHPVVYYNYAIPMADCTFLPEHILPVPHPVRNKCTIEELEENSEVEGKTQTEESSGPLVRSTRFFVRNKMRMKYRRRFSKVPHGHLVINCEEDFDDRTTVMLKNIPPQITKNELLSLLDDQCVKFNEHEGISVEFDFFYLPMDFYSGNNFGYAFVNFTSSSAVRKIYSSFQGYRWDYLGSDKILKVNYADFQGIEKLVSNVEGLKFKTTIPDSFMPSLFEPPRNGLRKSVERLLGNRVFRV